MFQNKNNILKKTHNKSKPPNNPKPNPSNNNPKPNPPNNNKPNPPNNNIPNSPNNQIPNPSNNNIPNSPNNQIANPSNNNIPNSPNIQSSNIQNNQLTKSIDISKIKVAVVTALFLMDFDKMDQIYNNFTKVDNWHYYLFTNNKKKCGNTYPYTVKEIDVSKFKYGVHATKNIKWLTHQYLPGYDIVIWVDSFICLNNFKIDDIKLLIKKVYEDSNTPIIMRKQAFKSVEEDIKWCLGRKRINQETALNIRKYLSDKKFPTNTISKTYWSSAIIKNNKNKKLQEFSNDLYKIVSTVGYRDQHWLPFLFKKYNLNCEYMPSNLFLSNRENYNEKGHHYTINLK